MPEFAGLWKLAFQREKDGISMKYDATFEGCRDGRGFVKCMSERADGGCVCVFKRVDSCGGQLLLEMRGRVIRYQNLVSESIIFSIELMENE